MIKIRLDKTKLSVNDNLVMIKVPEDDLNLARLKNNSTSNVNDSLFGEIYLSIDGRIYFTCKFCKDQFYCFKLFSSHFMDFHAIDWTDLIFSDGNYACCSKVEPEYTQFNNNLQVLNDIVQGQGEESLNVQNFSEDTKDSNIVTENDVINYDQNLVGEIQEVVTDSNSFINDQDVKDSEICQQQYIVYSNELDDDKDNSNSEICQIQEYVESENDIDGGNNTEVYQENECSESQNESQDLIEEKICTEYEKQIGTEVEEKIKKEIPVFTRIPTLVSQIGQIPNIRPLYAINYIRPEKTQIILDDDNPMNQLHLSNNDQNLIVEDSIDNITDNDGNDDDKIELPKDIDLENYPKPKHFHNLIREFKSKKCKFCHRKFPYLSAHYKKYVNKFTCHITQCSEPFDTEEELLEHTNELHPDEKLPFKCFYCDYKAPEKRCLTYHYRRNHLQERNYKCEKCDAQFFVKKELAAHQEGHHLLEEQAALNKVRTIQLVHPISSESDYETGEDEIIDADHQHFLNLMKQFHTRRCKICRKKSSLLSTHYRKIHFDMAICDINQCSEPFDTEEELQAHTDEIHVDPENPFKCGYCDYKSTEKRRLSYHYRRNHLVEKKFQCNYCDMKFFYEKERIQHHRVHTGEHPFNCNLCGQAFKTAVIMRLHIKRKHEPPKEICDVCGKLFATKDGLRNHRQIHQNEKPFGCDICGAAFLRKDSLKCHMNVHSDVKQFSCNYCDKRFAHRSTLREHYKSHQNPPIIKIPLKKGRKSKPDKDFKESKRQKTKTK